jgi:CheY-like chemotaxis protein
MADAAAHGDARTERLQVEPRRVSILLLARDHGGPNAPSRVLSNHGYVVHGVSVAAEVSRMAARHKDAAVAVIDIGLEGARGTDVYAGLVRSLPPDREIMAIFLARSPSVNDIVRALRLGAIDVLRSPIEPANLLDAVARAEAIVTRNAVLRAAAGELTALTRELTSRAADLGAAMRIVPPAAATQVTTGVDFAEPLDPQAQREDTSSLAFTQRQMRMVATAIKAQSLRRTIIGSCLGDDPCWDMLLDLHQKALSGQAVSVTSLCRVSAAPATTALRRLDDLVEAGLVLRRRDPDDARRVLVQLTDAGMQKLRTYFAAVSAAG